jgi:hypothetical protein
MDNSVAMVGGDTVSRMAGAGWRGRDADRYMARQCR